MNVNQQPAAPARHLFRQLITFVAGLETSWRVAEQKEAIAREFDDNWQLLREAHAQFITEAANENDISDSYFELLTAAPTLLSTRLSCEEMLEWVRHAMVSAEQRSAHQSIPVILTLRGVAERDSRNLQAAFQTFEQAKRGYLLIDDNAGVAASIANQCLLSAMAGDPRIATDQLEAARSHFKAVSDNRGLMKCSGAQAVIEMRQGNYSTACSAADDYLDLAQELDSRADEMLALGQLGTCHRRLGAAAIENGQQQQGHENIELAIDYYRAQRRLAEEFGDEGAQQRAIGNLGNAYTDLGRFEEAIACHRESLHLSEIMCNSRAIAIDHLNLGTVFLTLNRDTEAEQHLLQALENAHAIGDKAFKATVLWNLHVVLERLNNIDEAVRAVDECLRIRESINHQLTEETRAAFSKLVNRKVSNECKPN